MLEHCRDLFTRTGDTYGQALTAYTLGDLRLARTGSRRHASTSCAATG